MRCFSRLDPAPRTRIALALLLATVATSEAQTMISSCGITLTGDGALTQDIVCGGDFAVRMENGGTLDLQGFSITSELGVFCETRFDCRVQSTGATGRLIASGAAQVGLQQLGDGPTILDNVSVEGFAVGISINSASSKLKLQSSAIVESSLFGISGNAGQAYLENSAVTDGEGSFGITAIGKLTLVDSEISRNDGIGVDAGKVNMVGSSIADNGDAGIVARTVKIQRLSSVTGNTGDGVRAYAPEPKAKVKIYDSTILENGGSGLYGFESIKASNASLSDNAIAGALQTNDGFEPTIGMSLKECLVTGNGQFGLRQEGGEFRKLSVQDTAVTGNGTLVTCGTETPCADISSTREPTLRGDSTCGTSYVSDSGLPGQSWNVCTGD
jgi:hypothetical protein